MASIRVPELKVPDLHDKVGDLGDYLREQRESARLSLRQLASAAGVSNPYLSQIERGLRRPSAEVLQQIAKGLQISAEVLFLRAGILEASVGLQVEAAIHSDLQLTSRQKRVLLDIYATFRDENARAESERGAKLAKHASAAPEAAGSDAPGVPARTRVAKRAAAKKTGRRPEANRPAVAPDAGTTRPASATPAATTEIAAPQAIASLVAGPNGGTARGAAARDSGASAATTPAANAQGGTTGGAPARGTSTRGTSTRRAATRRADTQGTATGDTTPRAASRRRSRRDRPAAS